MTLSRTKERGEGKIGCVVSLLVLLAVSGAAYKVVPVLFSNNNLVTEAEDLGSRAALIGAPSIEKQLRAKAAELEIPEALAKGAVTATLQGDKQSGTCVIRLRYDRKIDFFGLYTYTLETDKTISRPYMDAR